MDADTTSPTVAISSAAGAPVTGPFSITVAFSEPVTGFELEDLVVGNGSASELQGNNASYMATITPAASGTVTVDIAAGAARDEVSRGRWRRRCVCPSQRFAKPWPRPGPIRPDFARLGRAPSAPPVRGG